MGSLDFSGQTLDGKYLVERELGRGGMGTVYLATHLGTERPVAIKIISPQYMQRPEFVERFRREARAAGRLRHPNVVDVTDFGFSPTSVGEVAYLVMEYLDGCTLGEILDEERNLPVSWTLDILEQVCSAVAEAHREGIIHRDLKPDNIWLEPNQRGGYTVKVLDFGIAKLEEHIDEPVSGHIPQEFLRSTHTQIIDRPVTVAGNLSTEAGAGFDTLAANDQTIPVLRGIQQKAETIPLAAVDSEGKTAIFEADHLAAEPLDPGKDNEEPANPSLGSTGSASGYSLLSSPGSAELTRVGAVLGTPLYMSPEQCKGEHLDPRSDIYSLAVIAYQMLSGEPPFSGDFKEVMESHKNVIPRPLKAKGVRKKMGWAIDSALAKDPDKRPQTAEAFASVLRARSEGLWALLRRAMVIYSQHLPKFIGLTALFYLPVIILTLIQVTAAFLRLSGLMAEGAARAIGGLAFLFTTLAGAFCATLIVGSIVYIVTQYLLIPLRPVRVRPALREIRRNWKRVSASGAIAAFLPIAASVTGAVLVFGAGWLLFWIIEKAFSIDLESVTVGAVLGGFGGLLFFFILYTWCLLVTPVAMMENQRIRDAFRRSQNLTRRAYTTSFGAAMIMFLIPMVLASCISFFVNVTARAFDPQLRDEAVVTESEVQQTDDTSGPNVQRRGGLVISINDGTPRRAEKMDMQTRVKHTLLESLIQLLWLPLQIIVLSFSGIIVALLYLKTRLAGGEAQEDLVERFEQDGRPRTKWQERVRQRLIRSGRIPSRP